MPPSTAGRATGIWRWGDLLPLRDRRHAVSLGEGDTPLLDITETLALPGVTVHVKCEHLNPTGSFKDRIAAVALSLVRERSLLGVLGTSSGNGGAAASAYGARAGRHVVLLALVTTPPEKLVQIRSTGATVHLVEGLGHDPRTTRLLAEEVRAAGARHGYLPFLTGGRYAPEMMTGARTIAYELAEQAAATTHVYAPVGGGGLYASLWRGYRDLAGAVPRLVAVQPSGCPTVRDALAGGPGVLTRPSTTVVSGLQVATLFDDDVPQAVAGSAGHLTEVTDDQVMAAHARLIRNGVFVEPAGATALAGLLADAEAGRLPAGSRAVLVATGAGWKDGGALRNLTDPRPPELWTAGIDELLDSLPSGPGRRGAQPEEATG
ncbi:threonine synthase [Dactylosporangium fulvum]|uniref:Pyridoxal-phosphate dependent enzyme n=1 Tax=Dactylosporangium fulvum TaxID=53359 RepID=A0ABY5VP82_9ACTN|nr:pyridoxal-phosphate dependent enzyme [Dactylosporangium fulvum]UWP78980.1 pyridoxal-phosphate dependent enzyme [Dactylosporangium fulvum]